jgi:hypothetical protein
MRNVLVIFFSINLIAMLSCSKNEVTSNKVKSPFTVMYELTSSSSIVPGESVGLLYTNSAQGTSRVNSSDIPSLPWKKTITVTDDIRPLTFTFKAISIYLKGPGTITGNIYVNVTKKASVTESSNKAGASSNLKDYATLNMQYIVE